MLKSTNAHRRAESGQPASRGPIDQRAAGPSPAGDARQRPSATPGAPVPVIRTRSGRAQSIRRVKYEPRKTGSVTVAAGCTRPLSFLLRSDVLQDALWGWEKFINAPGEIPALIYIGLAHAQFETIHPFLDGNGRIGRLLITLLLCQQKILRKPVLYLSLFFNRHREDYYARLQSVHDHGDWEAWLVFFLRGVAEISKEAENTAQAVLACVKSIDKPSLSIAAAPPAMDTDVLGASFTHPPWRLSA